jgi:hypothetical protein
MNIHTNEYLFIHCKESASAVNSKSWEERLFSGAWLLGSSRISPMKHLRLR